MSFNYDLKSCCHFQKIYSKLLKHLYVLIESQLMKRTIESANNGLIFVQNSAWRRRYTLS